MTPNDFLTRSMESPLFIDRDYLRQCHPGQEIEPLIAALQNPLTPDPVNPNPIFDVDHYSSVAGIADGKVRINPVHHYLTRGQFMDLSPNRFFDPAWFRLRNMGASRPGVTDLERALGRMNSGLAQFHPMIDVQMIAEDLGRPADRAFLTDLFRDFLGRADPNPLFDILHYENAVDEAFSTLGQVLDHYYSDQSSEDTSVLFDIDFFRNGLGAAAPESRLLHHYLTSEATVDVHPMLNGGNYRGAIRRLTGEMVTRPMEHYIRVGEAMGVSPGPFFDVAHYAAQTGERRRLLKHYLTRGYLNFDAHPALDAIGPRTGVPPSLEMARAQRAGKPILVPIVDEARYLRLFPAVQKSKENPVLHYLRTGFRGAFTPNGLISVPYVATSERRRALSSKEAVVRYVECGMQRRRRVLIVLRDLVDRAVTQSWLAVLETQSGQGDTEFLVLTEGLGGLADRFRLVAHVMAIGDGKTALDDGALSAQLRRFLQLLTPNYPEIAFVELGRDIRMVHLIANAGIPFVTLIDRAAATLEPQRLQAVLGRSAGVLASTAATRAWLTDEMNWPADKISLGATFVPSGPGRGRIGRLRRRRALLTELNLPETAFVIAGAGALTFEKGIDRFGLLARILTDILPEHSDAHFIWAGEGLTYPDTPYFYARHHMRLAGQLHRMHLLPAARQQDLRAAADLFVIAEAADVDVFEARTQESPTIAIGRSGFDPEIHEIAPIFDPVDLRAAAEVIGNHMTGVTRLRDGDPLGSDISIVIRALNDAIAATGLPAARFAETPALRVGSVAILLDRPETVALIARYQDPVDLYVIICETGEIAPDLLARLPEDKCAILSGAGQSNGTVDALMRLALRNYPADRLCVVGLRAVLPNLDVNAPGRVTTWLLPGHPGDEAAVAAMGEAFDLVLVAKGDDLVPTLRSEIEEKA